MKRLLMELEESKKELDILEEQFDEYMEKGVENEILENRCDKAYERYYNIAQEVAQKIVDITKGAVVFEIARRMVYQKPEELKKLFAREGEKDENV